MRSSNESVVFNPSEGPIKWCTVCGERHPARQKCDLVSVVRESRLRTRKSGKVHGGNLVIRWTKKRYDTKVI